MLILICTKWLPILGFIKPLHGKNTVARRNTTAHKFWPKIIPSLSFYHKHCDRLYSGVN